MSEDNVVAHDPRTLPHSPSSPQQARSGTITPNLIVRSDTHGNQPEHAYDASFQAPYAYAAHGSVPPSPFFAQGEGVDRRMHAGGLQSRPAYDGQGYADPSAAMHWQGEPTYDPRMNAAGPYARNPPQMTAPFRPQQSHPGYDDPRNRAFGDHGYLHHPNSPYAPHYNAFQFSQGAPMQPGMQSGMQSLPMRPHVGYMPQQPNAARHGPHFAQSPAFEGMPHSVGQYDPVYYQTGNISAAPAGARGQALPASSGRTPSYPRGPPRKPKQSGYAVWVGNLSPGTTIEQLKDYFARGATSHIESVFLISKSNCAFVNYKSPESAQAAVARFHDSRLNGVRLVCRLRHNQSQSTTETAVPSATKGSRDGGMKDETVPETMSGAKADAVIDATQTKEGIISNESSPGKACPGDKRVQEKFFVVKSLTLQDLEASVRDGVWATQAHNEAALNEAFASANTVYLIFSANKSGEYFGYARMLSAIDPNSTEVANRTGQAAPTESSETPTSTPTPATDTAPPGRIVDDSARGTIFWEADTSSDSEEDTNEQSQQVGAKSAAQSRRAKLMEEAEKQDWGKPFKIEWVSTSRLPFFKTRGLRNPWNANREIKIARDGTELEPSVGRRLLDMFNDTGPQHDAGMLQQHHSGPVIAIGSHAAGHGTFRLPPPGQ